MVREKQPTQEQQLREKKSIGDWFLVVCMVVLVAVAVLNAASDNTVSKGLTAIEKMLPKKP